MLDDFTVALKAMRAAPPSEPWCPHDDRDREAQGCWSRAMHALEQRLRSASVRIDQRNKLLLGSVAPVGGYELVVHHGRWVAHVQPSRSTPRHDPVIVAARAALAGAWWHFVPYPPPRLYRGAPAADWLEDGQYVRPWRTRDEARSTDLRSCLRRPDGFAQYARRETAVLVEIARHRRLTSRARRGPIRSDVPRQMLQRALRQLSALGVQIRVRA